MVLDRHRLFRNLCQHNAGYRTLGFLEENKSSPVSGVFLYAAFLSLVVALFYFPAHARFTAESGIKRQPTDSKPPAPAKLLSRPNYDLFISHASEDKKTVARPLYVALTEKGVSVWFDEAELTLGDSLRRKNDQGLTLCRFGVVILSPRFLSKEWPQRELDGLVARETATGEKAVLPVWHEINAETLRGYSPALADKLAVNTSEGIPSIVEKILRALHSVPSS